MSRTLLKITFVVAFMASLLAVFCISTSALSPVMPDGKTVTERLYPADECNRYLNVFCYDTEGNHLKTVSIGTKHGVDATIKVQLYDYRLVSFSSDQGLWETCKLSYLSGGSHFYGEAEINYYFRTVLSQESLSVTTVWEPFDEITIREEHYKMYRIGNNLSIRDDRLVDESKKVLYCGDYYSTSAKSYTGWKLSSGYSSGFSGNWTMAWIGDYGNIASLNDCMTWDVVWYTDQIKEERPWFTEYDEATDGNLTYIENRVVTVSYYYAPDWCTYTFNANGGTGGPTGKVEQWYDHQTTIPSEVPTRSGYTFLGWGSTTTDTTADYQPGQTFMMRTSRTLYAIWSAPAEYLVEYDANGGSGAPGSQVKVHDVDLTLRPRKPYRARHTFLGWGTSASATTPSYQPSDTYTTNASAKLYAIWEKDNYEFSVSNLQLSAAEVYQNETIEISVIADSWDRKNAYYEIPVELYIDGVWKAGNEVDFAAYGRNTVKFQVNVGVIAGAHEVEVRINWDNRSYETNPDNNSVKTIYTIRRDENVVGIRVLTGDEYYKEGTEVITGYLVTNQSDHDIIPSDGLTASFRVSYSKNGMPYTVTTQTMTGVVIPAGKANLIYFKWRVPAGTKGQTMYCQCIINSNGAMEEYNMDDNTATLTTLIAGLPVSQTENPSYSDTEPAGFRETLPPEEKTGSASWTQWVYANGTFSEKKFGIKISMTNPAILPGSTCPSAQYNIEWHMKSGYGVQLIYQPRLVALSGSQMPEVGAYTGIQSVYATFPEMEFQKSANCYRTLDLVGGKWQFVQNAGAANQERLHYIPVWFDDGRYIVSVTVSEIWTPAGMIKAVRKSNIIHIDGSLFDDFYVGTADAIA